MLFALFLNYLRSSTFDLSFLVYFCLFSEENLLKVNDSEAAGPFIKHPRDPSHSKISIHILNTVLYTFPIVLTKRICFAIKSFFI